MAAEAPSIIVPPEGTKIAAEGTPVNLTCRTTGKPDPTVAWYKDDVLITGGRYIINRTGDLHLRVWILFHCVSNIYEAVLV